MSGKVRCAAACGRELEPEDMVEVGGALVCEPCSVSIARAAERRDSIDDAWRAVESFAGYQVVDLHIVRSDEINATLWFAAAQRDDEPKPCALGQTPVLALRALAAKLDDELPHGAT